jgi:two-component system response regulator QseB
VRILLGDGQKSFLQLIQQRLFGQFEFDWAKDVPSLNNLLVQRAYALVILAMDVPFEDRIRLVEQCREVSGKSAIMVVSEPVPVQERVQSIEAGVDDYVMRPVHVDEFAARAKALVRRADASHFTRVKVGNLELTGEGEFFLHGSRVVLQQAEQKVLSILARRTGRIVSKAMLDRAIRRLGSGRAFLQCDRAAHVPAEAHARGIRRRRAHYHDPRVRVHAGAKPGRRRCTTNAPSQEQ